MKARRIHEWGGSLALDEIPAPIPAAGEVLLEVEACGIGLTVLNCIRGDLGHDPAGLPRIPGHEVVGRITEVGAGVDRQRIGEQVCAFFYLFCGHCRLCLAGMESLCQNLEGYLGVNRDGGYAELMTLPARNAVALPESLDPVLATAIPDAIATPVHVARRAGIAPGDRVAVIAAGGGVGIHMVQVAQLYGAEVAALDAVDDKLAYLRQEFGADVVNSSDFESVSLPPAWCGKPDIIVDLLGNAASLTWAARSLDTSGRLVLLTTFPGVEFTASPRDLVFTQGAILGSRYASRSEVALAAELVATGRVRPIVSRRVGLADVETVHDALREGTLLGRGALDLT